MHGEGEGESDRLRPGGERGSSLGGRAFPPCLTGLSMERSCTTRSNNAIGRKVQMAVTVCKLGIEVARCPWT